jgi:hypothetical protein
MRRRVSPLDAAFSLVADPILGDAGIAARLAVDALRLLGFLGWFVAQTGTHELLTRVIGHAFRLRICSLSFSAVEGSSGRWSRRGPARWGSRSTQPREATWIRYVPLPMSRSAQQTHGRRNGIRTLGPLPGESTCRDGVVRPFRHFCLREGPRVRILFPSAASHVAQCWRLAESGAADGVIPITA